MAIETLVITGPVTLAEVVAWREPILKALGPGDGLRLDLSASGPWDLAGVQLLAAAVASGKRAGRAVRLAGVPEVCATTLARAGLAAVLAGSIDGHLA